MKNIIITITAVLLLTSCGNKKSEEETTEKATIENITTLTDAQIKNAGIQIGKIEQKEIIVLCVFFLSGVYFFFFF